MNVESDERIIIKSVQDEFRQIVGLIKERRSRLLEDAENTVQVSFYGSLGQHLIQLKNKIKSSLCTETVVELSMGFADKLNALQEYESATHFYSIVAQDATEQLEYEVQSRYGIALCRMFQRKQLDSNIRYPSTLSEHLKSLKEIQQAMQKILEYDTPEKYSWLILNGIIHIYSIAKPMLTLGFAQNVVDYLNWSILAMESLVSLCTIKHLAWRTRLYATICQCYLSIAKTFPESCQTYQEAAKACLTRALDKIKQLRREEEMDPPLPATVDEELSRAKTNIRMLFLQFQNVSSSKVLAEFPTPQIQMRAIMEVLPQSKDPEELVSTVYSMVEDLFLRILPFGVENSPLVLEQAYEELDGLFPVSMHLQCLHNLSTKSHQHWDQFVDVAESRLNFTSSENHLKKQFQLLTAWHRLQQSTKPYGEENADVQLISANITFDSVSFFNLCKLLQDMVSDLEGLKALDHQHDFIADIIHQLWTNYTSIALNQLDSELSTAQVSIDLRSLVIEGLSAIHLVAFTIDLDDIVLRSIVTLRLGILLQDADENRRSVQVLRSGLDAILSTRSKLTSFILHQSRVQNTRKAFCWASFSTRVHENLAVSDCPSGDARDAIGVAGTGSQLGGSYDDLCTLQTDIESMLFKSELRCSPNASETVTESKCETRLLTECRKNGYTKAMLLLQIALRDQIDSRYQNQCLENAVESLRLMEAHEKELCDALELETSRKTEKLPPAPRIVSRAFDSITIELQPYNPPGKRKVQYFMVYGKAAGAGTDVSLNNCEFPGTGEPVFPSSTIVTIANLLPNEKYVFAIAAYDDQDRVIHGIGSTSLACLAVCPLPLLLCWGYVATTATTIGNRAIASMAGNTLYEYFVSTTEKDRTLWQSNPINKVALRLDVMSRASLPLLEIFVQSMFLLIKDLGSATDDGAIVGSATEGKVLSPIQKSSLEMIKRSLIALEVASAAEHIEYIKKTAFRTYQLIVSMLHLKFRNYYVLHGLTMIQQALQLVPREEWDVDVRDVFAHVSYELAKFCLDLGEYSLLNTSLNQIHPLITEEPHAKCDKFQSLTELLLQVEQHAVTRDTNVVQVFSEHASSENQVIKLLPAPMDAYQLLNKEWKETPRYMELACKVFRQGLKQGLTQDVKEWVEAVKLSAEKLPYLEKVIQDFDLPHEEEEPVQEEEEEEEEGEPIEDEENQRRVKIIEPVDETPLEPTPFEVSMLKWWGEFYLVKSLTVVSRCVL